MLGVLTDVEFVTKFFNDFLRNLTFEHSQKLNILTTVKLNLENTDWFLLLLHWWQSGSRCLGLNLRVTRILCSRVVSWLSSSLVIGASISSWSSLWLRVLLISSITWSALRSLILRFLLLNLASCERFSSLSERILILLLLLESSWWLTVCVWDVLIGQGLVLALHNWSCISERLALVHWFTLSHWRSLDLSLNLLLLNRLLLRHILVLRRTLVILGLLLIGNHISNRLLSWHILLLLGWSLNHLDWLLLLIDWLLNELLHLLNWLLHISFLLRSRLSDLLFVFWLGSDLLLRLRLSNDLWSLGRCFKLSWLFIIEIILDNLFLNLWREESVSIIVGLSFSLGNWSLLLVHVVFLILILNSAVLNKILSFLKKCFMLGLEHLQFLKCIITNFFELLLVLSINLLLDIFPIIV